MDRFEYPNQEDVLPAIMVGFAEAQAACEAEGKRLCGEAEWTFACRGVLALSACHHGVSRESPDRHRLWEPETTSAEVARIDARRPSNLSLCVSPSAVFDLPGNVEEWVRSERPEYEAAVKGGHATQSSLGCERAIYVQQIFDRAPQRGFRCCADPLVRPPG